MASLSWKPTTPKEVAVFRVAGVPYTFLPNVPQDVPKEHLAAATTALQATGTVTSRQGEI